MAAHRARQKCTRFSLLYVDIWGSRSSSWHQYSTIWRDTIRLSKCIPRQKQPSIFKPSLVYWLEVSRENSIRRSVKYKNYGRHAIGLDKLSFVWHLCAGRLYSRNPYTRACRDSLHDVIFERKFTVWTREKFCLPDHAKTAEAMLPNYIWFWELAIYHSAFYHNIYICQRVFSKLMQLTSIAFENSSRSWFKNNTKFFDHMYFCITISSKLSGGNCFFFQCSFIQKVNYFHFGPC